MEPYKNKSIWKWVTVYKDDQGISWRRQKDSDIYTFYKENKHMSDDESFYYDGILRTKRKASIQKIHEMYISSKEQQ